MTEQNDTNKIDIDPRLPAEEHEPSTPRHVTQIGNQQDDVQELRYRARDAGYDADSEFDLAFEPWLRDLNIVFDDNRNDWGLIGLDPEKVYASLLQIPFSGSVQLLIFAVDVQRLPRGEWMAELKIYHIADLAYGDEPGPIFEYTSHREIPLTIQVDMNRCGEELTFAGGIGIECLEPNICNAVHALSALLQGRANLMADAENVEYLM